METSLLALLLAFLRGETTHGKLLSKSEVSRCFYLLSANDTYLVRGPTSVFALHTVICFTVDLTRHSHLSSYP